MRLRFLMAVLALLMAVVCSYAQTNEKTAQYVGSESCKGCHAETYAGWKQTRMARVVQDPKEHPEAVKAFLADYVDGLAWFYDPANREKAIQLVSDFTKSSKDVLNSYFATGRDYYRDPNACVSAQTIQKPLDAMFEEKLIDRRIDVSKYLNVGLLPRPCAL